MRQYIPMLLAALVCAFIGAFAGYYLEASAGLPWWFSDVAGGLGAGVGVFFGGRYVQSQRSK